MQIANLALMKAFTFRAIAVEHSGFVQSRFPTMKLEMLCSAMGNGRTAWADPDPAHQV